MTATDQFRLSKHASNLARVSALAPLATFLPFSTYNRVHDHNEGWRGAGAGISTDVGRGVGGLTGMIALKGLQNEFKATPSSAAARAALMLAAVGSGATAGHYRGKMVGDQMFHPGNFTDRLKRSLNAF